MKGGEIVYFYRDDARAPASPEASAPAMPRAVTRRLDAEVRQAMQSPDFKARLRSLAQDRTRKRMLGQVSRATVVIANQTHFEVALRYEPSRGGALFPHLYGPLPLTAVRRVTPLPIGPEGTHIFPDFTRG